METNGGPTYQADTPAQLREAIRMDMVRRVEAQTAALGDITSRTEMLRAEGRRDALRDVARVLAYADLVPLEPGQVTDAERERVEMAKRHADSRREDLAKTLLKVAHDAESLVFTLKRRVEELRAAPHNGKDPKHTISTSPTEYFSWAWNDIENFCRNINASTAIQRVAYYACARSELPK